jgi:selenocysteine lyase/cysteine desulfurase
VKKDMYAKLIEKDIICAQRGNGIRLSFHFYNTENEIDKIVDILKGK